MSKLIKYRGLFLVLGFVLGGVLAPPAHAVLMMAPTGGSMAHHGHLGGDTNENTVHLGESIPDCPYLQLYETIDVADGDVGISGSTCSAAPAVRVDVNTSPIQWTSIGAHPDRGPPAVLPNN